MDLKGTMLIGKDSLKVSPTLGEMKMEMEKESRAVVARVCGGMGVRRLGVSLKK